MERYYSPCRSNVWPRNSDSFLEFLDLETPLTCLGCLAADDDKLRARRVEYGRMSFTESNLSPKK